MDRLGAEVGEPAVGKRWGHRRPFWLPSAARTIRAYPVNLMRRGGVCCA
jgi:hypothetical protein